MQHKEIDFGKAILKTLELVIVKPLTLPYKIYINALVALSNTNADDSEESNLSNDFPLYIWFVSIFNAIIFLSYPLGIVGSLITGFNSYDGFKVFIIMLIYTYFLPLVYGFVREILQITLKVLLYLKIISKK